MDLNSLDGERKSLGRWLCGVLFCCSCSRRTGQREAPGARSRRCTPRYCLQSPASVSLFVDSLFIISLLLVLYDASIVMRQRDIGAWWAVPAAIAGPTFLVVTLKLRYLRRLCDQHWEKDIIWNARSVLLPVVGALANTFLFAAWMLCAPLYIVERATATFSGLPLSLEDYTTVVREATFTLMAQPSSIAFCVSFVVSVFTAIYLSARHRRVLLRFAVHAMEEGVDVTGNRTTDTSLLTREELNQKNSYEPPPAATATQPATFDTQSIDSLYSTDNFVTERATYVVMPVSETVATFVTAEPATPRAPGAKTFDTMPKKVAEEAAARRAETLSRYDARTQPPPPRQNPAPPPYAAPPLAASSTMSNGGADDESETRMDSPRTIERIKRQRNSTRTRVGKDE